MAFVRLMLALAAAGLLLVTTLVLAAPLWWLGDLFSHFRLQYALAALILGLAALALRAYPAAVVLAAVALVHGWAIKDLWLGGGLSGVTPMTGLPLRIVSANVLAGNSAPSRVLDFVLAADADLVVLVDAQGERWREVLATIKLRYPHWAPKTAWRDGGAPVVVLFSRHPILDYQIVRAPGGRGSNILAEIAVAKCRLAVAAVHTASPSPTDSHDTRRRNRALAFIGKRIQYTHEPMIVTGDFNTSPWSPHFRDFLAATGLRNAADGHGYIGTWPGWSRLLRIPIDHVLIKGPLTVATITRGPAIGSDHFPIVADLHIAGKCEIALDPLVEGSRSAPSAGAS